MTDIGLRSLTLLTGEHFGTGVIIACFQDLGANLFLTDTLIMLVKTGEICKAKYLKNQNGMLTTSRRSLTNFRKQSCNIFLTEFCKIFSF